MIIGNLQAGRFEFVTLAATRAQAKKQLRDTWREHRKLTGATWQWADVEDACYFVAVDLGDTVAI